MHLAPVLSLWPLIFNLLLLESFISFSGPSSQTQDWKWGQSMLRLIDWFPVVQTGNVLEKNKWRKEENCFYILLQGCPQLSAPFHWPYFAFFLGPCFEFVPGTFLRMLSILLHLFCLPQEEGCQLVCCHWPAGLLPLHPSHHLSTGLHPSGEDQKLFFCTFGVRPRVSNHDFYCWGLASLQLWAHLQFLF